MLVFTISLRTVNYFFLDIYEVPPLFIALISPYSNYRHDLRHRPPPGIVTAEPTTYVDEHWQIEWLKLLKCNW